jgi:cell division protein ZipA
MELTIRDWMVIAGALLILAVLVDAVRRVRSDRYSRVKVKLVDEGASSDRDADLAWLKELPNGGARVVERGDLLKAAGLLSDDDDVDADAGSPPPIPPAPKASRRPVDEMPAAKSTAPDTLADAESPADNPDTLVTGISAADEPETLDWLDNLDGDQPPAQPEEEPGRLPRGVDPEVFMVNVVARNSEGFNGEDILHILLACDLRFGDMNFFHRHEFEAGRGAIQFSVANMMQPGVFDIDNMGDFRTPGLLFFVTLPGPEDMMKAFDYMIETAQAVARNLEGDVLDETRSVITRQTLEHSRQKIRDLERRLLAKAGD